MKMTQKQIFIGGLLLNHKEKGINVYEFIKAYKKEDILSIEINCL